jgi:hypothetical protein
MEYTAEADMTTPTKSIVTIAIRSFVPIVIWLSFTPQKPYRPPRRI